MNKVFAALRFLVRNPLYLILALVLASVLFFIYFLVNDLNLFRSAAAISGNPLFLGRVFANHVFVIAEASSVVNVGAVGAVALLGGINLALTILRVRRTKIFWGRAPLAGIFGTFGGAFAASCSACSANLIALLGISGGLAIFPFGGLEISLLAMVVLLISLYYLSRGLYELGLIWDNKTQ